MNWKRLLLIIGSIIAIFWVILLVYSNKQFDVDYGISFNQNHAISLGLDWKQVYKDMLYELEPSAVRIAAMWSEVEAIKGKYDFDDVDWMMETAYEYGTEVVLVIGQKAPRWPECHVPEWVAGYTDPEAREHLFDYARATVERYKDHEALGYWQVENEAFIRFEFGECKHYDKTAVYEEIDIVRSIDTVHPIIITDSGELSTWAQASKAGDIFGTTMYRMVRTPGGGIFTYDWVPAGFYRFKSALWGRRYDDFIVSELQAEPWFTSEGPIGTSVEEMEETMNPKRLEKHLDYATRVGASQVYLWGVEWWYFMKEVHNDARYWDMIKTQLNG